MDPVVSNAPHHTIFFALWWVLGLRVRCKEALGDGWVRGSGVMVDSTEQFRALVIDIVLMPIFLFVARRKAVHSAQK